MLREYGDDGFWAALAIIAKRLVTITHDKVFDRKSFFTVSILHASMTGYKIGVNATLSGWPTRVFLTPF